MKVAERTGFTVLEVATVVVIIALLIGLSLPVLSTMRRRAQRVRCMANLRNLSVGMNSYLQENGQWPQIPADKDAPREVFAQMWIDVLAPFQVSRDIWICPTIQNRLENPDYSTPDTARIDYFATSFDDKPTSPHEWPRQPWFVEAANAHGTGNLILFTDGSISDLMTVLSGSTGNN